MALRLLIEDVHAGYGAVRALHGASLEVNESETVALLGTNGNGKSTLIKCIIGDVRPTLGTVKLEIGGHSYDLTRLPTEEIVNLGVSIVPEGRRLFPKLTVEENLMLGAYRAKARTEIKSNLAFCVEAFPVLRERYHQSAGALSGGQQQMLALARALMSSPKLLLIDEPSVGLAPILVSHTITKIKELKERHGLTVLMAEQNFHEAIRIADRGYILVHGKVAFSAGSIDELRNSELVQKLYLGG